MRYKTFEQFIFEKDNKDYLKKINFLLAGEKLEGLTGKNNQRIYGEINDVCLNKLFNAFYAEGDYGKKLDVDSSLPLIYYGGNKPEGFDFIKRYGYKEENMYNVPSEAKDSGNKTRFYKMFDGVDFIPKAVYSREEAKDLEYPVIAKPDGEHSGLGIEIFDTHEELMKSDAEFDNYSEAKDLDREYRALLLNDKNVLIHERVSMGDNEIEDKESDEQTNFVYVDQDMKKLDFLDELDRVAKEIRKKIKLGLWSIDIMIDKSGKLWVAEINAGTGMAADKMARVYVDCYEDFYGEELSREFKDQLHKEYIQPIYKINLEKNKEQIKQSNGAVDYEKVINGDETIF
jgi:hypothetical protein